MKSNSLFMKLLCALSSTRRLNACKMQTGKVIRLSTISLGSLMPVPEHLLSYSWGWQIQKGKYLSINGAVHNY